MHLKFVSAGLLYLTTFVAAEDYGWYDDDDLYVYGDDGYLPSQQGCCSWHNGVCGCSGGRTVCCDGSFSPSCECGYSPEEYVPDSGPSPTYPAQEYAPFPTPRPTRSTTPAPTPSNEDYWCELLNLSDYQLVQMATERAIGTYCYIQMSNPDSGDDCDFYVKGRGEDSSYNGIPLTSDDLSGTGCVREGRGSSCHYQDPRYPLSQKQRDSMCTNSLLLNAAAQLRFGIQNGYCMDNPNAKCSVPSPTPEPTPSTTSEPTPGPTPSPTPEPTPGPMPSLTPEPTSGLTPSNEDYWCELLSLSDNQLFQLGVEQSIGTYCFIQVSNPDSGNACEFYVKGRREDSSYNGIPLTSDDLLGTGCVRKGHESPCHYQDPRYPLTQIQRDSMCTDSLVANAAAQLRFGIQNGHCMDNPNEKCSVPSLTPEQTPGPTPSPTPGLTPSPTSEPTPRLTPSLTPEPTSGPTPLQTPEPTPGPTAAPTSSSPKLAPLGTFYFLFTLLVLYL